MTGKNRTRVDARGNEYREVQVKSAMYATLIVVAAVALPLGWLNMKIGAQGSKIADTSRYHKLVSEVDRDVKTIGRMLDDSHMDEQTLKGTPVVTIITPDIMPTNMDEAAAQDRGKFQVEVNGIYWNTHNPLVTINGENYRVGEFIQGHRIIEIRQTEVLFEDPMGEQVVKYFYDYLDTPKKKKK